ncbi:hypothetical protein OPT61_g4062 [Boeremia exigua]|uniref:Uncharacterized protein n=1 Tax=Boeremia exigua TaxID=749465 RepID=A0ACC2IFI9_9PLEO|nr:hypothetical protein OPT61_g4062 [Boeremia exigua]
MGPDGLASVTQQETARVQILSLTVEALARRLDNPHSLDDNSACTRPVKPDTNVYSTRRHQSCPYLTRVEVPKWDLPAPGSGSLAAVVEPHTGTLSTGRQSYAGEKLNGDRLEGGARLHQQENEFVP